MKTEPQDGFGWRVLAREGKRGRRIVPVSRCFQIFGAAQAFMELARRDGIDAYIQKVGSEEAPDAMRDADEQN